MDLSMKINVLIGILLVEISLKADAICKEDQSKICRSISEAGDSSPQNAGTCIAKRYSSFTHVCSVHDYSPSVAFCCCMTQRSHPGSQGHERSSETTLCCRYFQAWNTFRCDEDKDAVPLYINSNLASVKVWMISLILLALISLFTLFLIGYLRKAMTNRKKDRFNNNNNMPPGSEKQYHHHHHQFQHHHQDRYFHPANCIIAPLIPTAPFLEDDTEPRKELSNSQENNNNSNTNNNNNTNNIIDNNKYINNNINNTDTDNNNKYINNNGDTSPRKLALSSTTDSKLDNPNCWDDYDDELNASYDENVVMNCNMLRDSIYVEDNIETNCEPPPPYDEVVGLNCQQIDD